MGAPSFGATQVLRRKETIQKARPDVSLSGETGFKSGRAAMALSFIAMTRIAGLKQGKRDDATGGTIGRSFGKAGAGDKSEASALCGVGIVPNTGRSDHE